MRLQRAWVAVPHLKFCRTQHTQLISSSGCLHSASETVAVISQLQHSQCAGVSTSMEAASSAISFPGLSPSQASTAFNCPTKTSAEWELLTMAKFSFQQELQPCPTLDHSSCVLTLRKYLPESSFSNDGRFFSAPASQDPLLQQNTKGFPSADS